MTSSWFRFVHLLLQLQTTWFGLATGVDLLRMFEAGIRYADKNHPEGHRIVTMEMTTDAHDHDVRQQVSTSKRYIISPVVNLRPVIRGHNSKKDDVEFTIVGEFLTDSSDVITISPRHDDREQAIKEGLNSEQLKQWAQSGKRKAVFDFSGVKKKEPFLLYASFTQKGNLVFDADGNEWVRLGHDIKDEL